VALQGTDQENIMRMNRSLLVGGIIGATGLLLGFAGGVYSQRQAAVGPLNKRLAAASGVAEETVAKVTKALGPTILANLKKGRAETVDGLGTFKVVRVQEHRDMRDGRPVTIPASNYVVFTPAENVDSFANEEGVTPESTVPEFKYIPLPNQTPSQRTPRVRTPSIRSR
jgi:nucleoid DNA-binding protein